MIKAQMGVLVFFFLSLPSSTGNVDGLSSFQISNPSQRIPDGEARSTQDAVIHRDGDFGIELHRDDKGQGGGREVAVSLPVEVSEKRGSYGKLWVGRGEDFGDSKADDGGLCCSCGEVVADV
jgi:hypothetical protein